MDRRRRANAQLEMNHSKKHQRKYDGERPLREIKSINRSSFPLATPAQIKRARRLGWLLFFVRTGYSSAVTGASLQEIRLMVQSGGLFCDSHWAAAICELAMQANKFS